MRWSIWAAASSFVACAMGSDATYDKFLKESRASKGVLSLTTEDFNELIAEPRNYTVTALLTAENPRMNCVPCKIVGPEYREAGRQFENQRKDSKHFFAIVDVDKAMGVFQGYSLSTAPHVFFYPAESKGAHDSIDLVSLGVTAKDIVDWHVSRHVFDIKFKDPKALMRAVTGTLGAVALILASVFAWPHVSSTVRSRGLWCSASIAWILVMSSGLMWVNIRHPMPFHPRESSFFGRYVQGGYQTQYAFEVYVVAGLYALLALSLYVLLFLAPLNTGTKQKVTVLAWSAFFIYSYHVLLQVFNIKQPGYPFTY